MSKIPIGLRSVFKETSGATFRYFTYFVFRGEEIIDERRTQFDKFKFAVVCFPTPQEVRVPVYAKSQKEADDWAATFDCETLILPIKNAPK